MVERTPIRRLTLRRYSPSSVQTCPGQGYHNASDTVASFELHTPSEEVIRDHYGIPDDADLVMGHGWARNTGPLKGALWKRWEHWPATCEACGYRFTEADEWQCNIDAVWRRADNLEELDEKLWQFPVGAMYWADWVPENWLTHHDPRGALTVQTPGGPWTIDQKASDATGFKETGWTRTGEPPLITASPSIHIVGAYHGFLVNGVLSDPL